MGYNNNRQVDKRYYYKYLSVTLYNSFVVKKAVLSVLFVSILFSVNAQHNRFIGGVLFDLNGIGLLGNTGQFWNSSTENDGAGHGGISCGIFVKHEFTKKMYSTLELRYSTKGSYYGFVSPYGTQASESLYLSYLELPLLIGYKIRPVRKIFYLECGFEFSKLINSRIEANEQIGRSSTPDTKDLKSSDISMIGDIKFPLIRNWEEKFLFGIRVTRSIPSIHKYCKIYNFEYGIELNYVFN